MNSFILKDEISLIEKYSEAIDTGNAALFIGSGISAGLGKASWKRLLHDTCRDLGINIDNNHVTYPELAQFWVNKHEPNRRQLTDNIKKILDEKKEKPSYSNSVYNEICHLNIRDIWTTNYDSLIEEAYTTLTDKNAVAIDNDNEILSLSGSEDVRIYKMHGSLKSPSKMVITSDDYFSYRRKRPFFTESLYADLLKKTFLFIGFSFDDPNIKNVLQTLNEHLDHIKEHHNESLRNHYLILYSSANSEQEVLIEEHKITSLSKLGITTLRVNRENDPIKSILYKIRKYSNRKNVVIAGSCRGNKTWAKLPSLSNAFGRHLIYNSRGYDLNTCYGDGVGKDSIEGALIACAEKLVDKASDRVRIWPTYEKGKVSPDDKRKIDAQRSKMINNAAACIFMGGVKGTYDEFILAKEKKKFCIPVEISGGITKTKIMNEYYAYFDEMCTCNNVSDARKNDLQKELEIMENNSDIEELIKSIFYILDLYHDCQFDNEPSCVKKYDFNSTSDF